MQAARHSSVRAIVLSSAVIFVYGTVASMLGTLLPTLSAKFHLSPEQSGYVAALQAAGLMLATLASGPLMDSSGIKVVLCGGLAMMLSALLMLVAAASWSGLLVSIFILGLGSGTVVAASNNLASDVDARRRSSMVNLANVFFGLGGLATPFVAANLMAGNPMRLTYLVDALVLIVLLFASIAPFPNRVQSGFRLRDLAGIERKTLLLFLCGLMLVYVASELAVWNWLPKYLINHGEDPRTALNILGFGFACGIILGRLVAMQVLRRVAAIVLCIVAGIAMVASSYAAVHVVNPAAATIAVLCSGIAMGPVFPSVVGITGDQFPRLTGTCIALVITSGWLGGAVSSWIIGKFAGSDPTRLSGALMIIPILSLLIVALALMIRRMLLTTSVEPAA